MTCQVIAVGPDNTSYKARALLDSTSSTSFISERVAQHIRLPRLQQDSKVSEIRGGTMRLSLQASANFIVKSVHSGGKTHKILFEHTLMFSGLQQELEASVKFDIS